MFGQNNTAVACGSSEMESALINERLGALELVVWSTEVKVAPAAPGRFSVIFESVLFTSTRTLRGH